jgi:hypothetical protein
VRSVVLMMSVSVDGLVAGPHGHAGGLAEPNELKRWKLDRVRQAGTHIMGRVTYEEMAAYWPTSTDDYAAPMNEIPKVAFSKALDQATWAESSIARGDLEDEIANLRRQPGGEIIAWAAPASLSRFRGPDSLTNTFSSFIPSRSGAACRCSGTCPTRCGSNCSRRKHSTPAPYSTSTSRAIEPTGPADERRPSPGCTRSGAFGRGAEFGGGGYAHLRMSRRHGLRGCLRVVCASLRSSGRHVPARW